MKLYVFGIFPETAWQVMTGRQAIHPFYANFWFWKKNRLAVHSQLPGDA